MGLWHQDWEEYGNSLQLALGGAGATDSSSEETAELTAISTHTRANTTRATRLPLHRPLKQQIQLHHLKIQLKPPILKDY